MSGNIKDYSSLHKSYVSMVPPHRWVGGVGGAVGLGFGLGWVVGWVGLGWVGWVGGRAVGWSNLSVVLHPPEDIQGQASATL